MEGLDDEEGMGVAVAKEFRILQFQPLVALVLFLLFPILLDQSFVVDVRLHLLIVLLRVPRHVINQIKEKMHAI